MKINGKYILSKKKRERWKKDALDAAKLYDHHDDDDQNKEKLINERINDVDILKTMYLEEEMKRNTKKKKLLEYREKYKLFQGRNENVS